MSEREPASATATAQRSAALRLRLAQFAAYNEWERETKQGTDYSTPAERLHWAGEALRFARRIRPEPEVVLDEAEIARRVEIRRRLSLLDEYLRERARASRSPGC
jgi:hypothetical protein